MTSLREHLDEIRSRRGSLTPEIVLDEARAPEHPLHQRFEWDDSVAAERWRKQQAHDLIVSVRVKRPDQSQGLREARAFHAVRREDGHIYMPTEEVVRDKVATKILLADMERQWRELYHRWKEFAEFAKIVRQDIDEAA